jgi:hypothetical protein
MGHTCWVVVIGENVLFSQKTTLAVSEAPHLAAACTFVIEAWLARSMSLGWNREGTRARMMPLPRPFFRQNNS